MVPPTLTHVAWPLIEHWVIEALRKGKGHVEPQQLKEWLEDNMARLWLAWDDANGRACGCCIAEITNSARGKALNLVVIAGKDMVQWWDLLEDMKAFARMRGCVRLESSSRAGIIPQLKARGWRPLHTVMELRLDDNGKQQVDHQDKYGAMEADTATADRKRHSSH